MRHPSFSLFAAAWLATAIPAPAPAQQTAEPTTIDLVVAATTDVHGNLRGWDYYANASVSGRGLSRAATIVDSLRRSAPNRVVLVDAGDLLQGNPLTYVAARIDTQLPHPVIAAMNAMNYDAAAIGNHEFNYGLPILRRAVGQASFPFLAANAFTPGGAHAFRGWTMVERGGVRVAIVGATTPGSLLWDRDHLRGQLEIRDILPAVREAVVEARRAGADVVVVALHSGLDEPSSYDTVSTGVPSENVSARVARDVRGIDVIVYGHTHKQMADTVIGGTLLIQPKNWAASVGVAHLVLERGAEGWRVVGRRGQLVAAAGHAEDPAVLAATEAAHRATVAYATTAIGQTPVAWRADSARVADTPLIDFILEVERRATGAQLASTAAFSLDASLAAGPITVARLAALYPYDNTLRVVRVSGRQLRDYLEYSARYYREAGSGDAIVDPSVPGYNFDIVAGVDYVIDLAKPVGERITTLSFRGRPVAPSDSFTFALNNYRQTGGGGYAMLRGARVLDDRQLEIRQLLIDDVRAKRVLRPEDYFHRSWEIIPASAVTEAYAAMHPPRVAPAGGAAAVDVARLPAAVSRLRIIATNDFHGALESRPDNTGVQRGGAAALAGVIAAARAECAAPACEAILLDGGDMFQGTPASNFASGRPVVAIYNTLDYSASALGNHEFDWGQDTLRAIMRAAHYRILGANVRYADGRDVEWIPNDTIVTRGAYRIGLIGVATTETPHTTRASNTTGLRFDDPVPIVDSLTRVLRARGVDAVVVLAHAGAFCSRDGATDCAGEIVDLARRLTTKVDAIVSGHTHSLVNTEVNGIPIVQARSRGQAVDVVDLPMHGAAGATQHAIRDVVADAVVPDTRVAAIVAAAEAAVAPVVRRPEARVAGGLAVGAVGDLIADAMRVEGHGDLAMMNNGGIRAPLHAGTATYGALFEVQPFANVLYRETVRGRDLRAYLERRVRGRSPDVHLSGAVVTYDPALPAGSRIVDVRLHDGSPLADDRTYTVVLNDFMVTNDNLGFGGRSLKSEPANLVDLDAFVDYLRGLPQPVTPPADARFVVREAK